MKIDDQNNNNDFIKFFKRKSIFKLEIAVKVLTTDVEVFQNYLFWLNNTGT